MGKESGKISMLQYTTTMQQCICQIVTVTIDDHECPPVTKRCTLDLLMERVHFLQTIPPCVDTVGVGDAYAPS